MKLTMKPKLVAPAAPGPYTPAGFLHHIQKNRAGMHAEAEAMDPAKRETMKKFMDSIIKSPTSGPEMKHEAAAFRKVLVAAEMRDEIETISQTGMIGKMTDGSRSAKTLVARALPEIEGYLGLLLGYAERDGSPGQRPASAHDLGNRQVEPRHRGENALVEKLGSILSGYKPPEADHLGRGLLFAMDRLEYRHISTPREALRDGLRHAVNARLTDLVSAVGLNSRDAA